MSPASQASVELSVWSGHLARDSRAASHTGLLLSTLHLGSEMAPVDGSLPAECTGCLRDQDKENGTHGHRRLSGKVHESE